MKRLIGKLVVATVLSAGAAVVAASPSSALPDDRCMDEANYMTHDGWYTDQWVQATNVETAWNNPWHYVNQLSGAETWEIDLPSGAVVELHTQSDYNAGQAHATNDAQQKLDAYNQFLGTWSIC